ncbi:MAG: hypothetical protein ACYDC8_02305 [Gammaproteobacteria bacterium]
MHEYDTMLPFHINPGMWAELWLFWLLVFGLVVPLVANLTTRRAPCQRQVLPFSQRGPNIPELRLLRFALPLELLWEIAQLPLYDVWHRGAWNYILYSLAHCTLGDLLILLVAYELVALLAGGRSWYRSAPVAGSLLFTLLGTAYTVYSESVNVRIKGTWGYTDLMPIVPLLNIGGTPFLQWLLIPSGLILLMRQLSDGRVPRTAK